MDKREMFIASWLRRHRDYTVGRLDYTVWQDPRVSHLQTFFDHEHCRRT
jgi:hypothetical protein